MFCCDSAPDKRDEDGWMVIVLTHSSIMFNLLCGHMGEYQSIFFCPEKGNNQPTV